MPCCFAHRTHSRTPPRRDVTTVGTLWREAKRQVTLRNALTLAHDNFALNFTEDVHFLTVDKTTAEVGLICRDVLNRVTKTLGDRLKKKRNEHILLGLVKIIAEKELGDRRLVRDVLEKLFLLSGYINREILLFQHRYLSPSIAQLLNTEEKTKLFNKQEYILSQVCGWKFPNTKMCNPFNLSPYYVDLPFEKTWFDSTSHLMREALFKQKDSNLVLLLLRHGVHPSCVYLWPISFVMDLRQSIHKEWNIPLKPNLDTCATFEFEVIRYFCRARHYVGIHLIEPKERGSMSLGVPIDMTCDSVLLMSAETAGIQPPVVPLDRSIIPSPLKHQCRLTVRKSLLLADNLPRGLTHLHLPQRLINYVNLLDD